MVLQAASLKGKINAKDGVLIGVISKPVGYTDYTESYEVTPKTSEQILKTKDKHMTDDVTVRAIPYFNVGNNAGGSTFYIAKEVE